MKFLGNLKGIRKIWIYFVFIYFLLKKRKRLNRDSQGLRTPRDRIKRILQVLF